MNKHIDPSPEQRIKLLEKALKDEQDRNLVYKTMLEIMEKEYGMIVPKKFLPKQSKGFEKKD
ncbi:hypothetical protein D3C86_1631540 [compost metagenome]